MTALGHLWCRLFHHAALWPIHNRYVCATCLREHPVEWEISRVEPRVEALKDAATVAIMEAQ